MGSGWFFRFLYVVGAVVAGVGAVLLLIGFAREHRDVQRLWILAAGWLGLGVGALVLMAAKSFGRREGAAPQPGAEGDG